MSENFKPRRPEEPETYVEDVDKAYFMANSNAKYHEEKAAESRKFLNDLVNGENYEVVNVETKYGNLDVEYANTDYMTRQVPNKEGFGFHEVSANYWPGKASVTKNPNHSATVEDSITGHHRKADKIYKAADGIYDVLERTKR